MSLSPGTRLHAYEITGTLGAGGMGEVYRAHDARLGRDVAIKVLPATVSSDPAALARFEQEARAIGALNHPNIVNVFDVGSEHSVAYVVMELLEGETLRARLQGSAAHTPTAGKTPRPTVDKHRAAHASGSTPAHGLPRKKALEIAQQIAQGLAAAHARGIVHRDLKPENIFLTTDGRVKVLDFGLARAAPQAAQQLSNAQTQLSPNVAADSVPGLVLGTVGYMAPEQVRGQAVDHRADIFAFGAVLYEMLTGERAFEGESAIETMSAILKADPLEQPAATVAISGPIEPLLRHCLEKQPDERFQSARDLAFQLQAIASGSVSTSAAERAIADAKASARSRLIVPAVAAAALAIGIAIGYWMHGAAREESITVAVPMPRDVRVFQHASPARAGGIAVSRDGRQIAFVGSTVSAPQQVYIRSLDSPIVRAVPGTEGANFPSWSPDGRRVAFWQGGKLKQVALDGGSPQAIADMLNPRSPAAWGDDDTLLYHAEYRQPLARVPAGGGTPSIVMPVQSERESWFSPTWLPDGRRFLVVRFAYSDESAKSAGIYVGSVDSTDATLLVAGRISEVALGDGELFYRRGTELVAQPFDPREPKLSGEPRVLSDHVSMLAAAGGTLAYFDPPGGLSLGHRITWFSRTGAVLSRAGEAGTFRDPRLSPDGRSLAVARADDNGLFAIWTYDLARNIDSRITGATAVSPGWSRDGRAVLAGGPSGLLRFERGVPGGPQVVRPLPGYYTNVMDVSPDGRDALVQLVGTETVQLAALAMDGKSDPRPLGPPEPGYPRTAAFSPDGKWIALVAMEGTRRRLFVQPYPGPAARIAVAASEGYHPRWRRDGRELYFLAGGGFETSVMAVTVSWKASGPEFGVPQMLFKIQRAIVANIGFDVTSDGQKFVAIVADEPDASPLTVRMRVARR